MDTGAYVFITTRQPKKTLPKIRAISGLTHADALFSTTDIVAIVRGEDSASMDRVIDDIAELPEIIGTESKVARWLDGVGPPRPFAS